MEKLYLQKNVLISFCTLELTPPILYRPIVFMPVWQQGGGEKEKKTNNMGIYDLDEPKMITSVFHGQL